MRHGTPGYSGIMGILYGVVGVSLLMSLLFGDMMQWVPLGLAILVSLRVVQRLNK